MWIRKKSVWQCRKEQQRNYKEIYCCIKINKKVLKAKKLLQPIIFKQYRRKNKSSQGVAGGIKCMHPIQLKSFEIHSKILILKTLWWKGLCKLNKVSPSFCNSPISGIQNCSVAYSWSSPSKSCEATRNTKKSNLLIYSNICMFLHCFFGCRVACSSPSPGEKLKVIFKTTMRYMEHRITLRSPKSWYRLQTSQVLQ